MNKSIEEILQDDKNIRIILGALEGKGVLDKFAARNFFMWDDYRMKLETGMRIKQIYLELANEYHLSVERVECIILDFKHRYESKKDSTISHGRKQTVEV